MDQIPRSHSIQLDRQKQPSRMQRPQLKHPIKQTLNPNPRRRLTITQLQRRAATTSTSHTAPTTTTYRHSRRRRHCQSTYPTSSTRTRRRHMSDTIQLSQISEDHTRLRRMEPERSLVRRLPLVVQQSRTRLRIRTCGMTLVISRWIGQPEFQQTLQKPRPLAFQLEQRLFTQHFELVRLPSRKVVQHMSTRFLVQIVDTVQLGKSHRFDRSSRKRSAQESDARTSQKGYLELVGKAQQRSTVVPRHGQVEMRIDVEEKVVESAGGFFGEVDDRDDAFVARWNGAGGRMLRSRLGNCRVGVAGFEL